MKSSFEALSLRLLFALSLVVASASGCMAGDTDPDVEDDTEESAAPDEPQDEPSGGRDATRDVTCAHCKDLVAIPSKALFPKRPADSQPVKNGAPHVNEPSLDRAR